MFFKVRTFSFSDVLSVNELSVYQTFGIHAPIDAIQNSYSPHDFNNIRFEHEERNGSARVFD